MNRMKLGNVLITGGSGFIGTHLVRLSLNHADSVTVVDLASKSSPEVNHIQCDIRNLQTMISRMPSSIDTIFHLAARTSVLESITDPQTTFQTNVLGTQNVLEVGRILGATHFLTSSTNAVVGNFDGDTITESAILKPLTPYGSTKAAAEMLAHSYSASYGVASTMLRLTNVYGEGMWKKDSIVPRLMRTALGKSQFSIYGDGDQFRDYVHVSDVVQAFINLATKSFTGPVIIGSGESVTVKELISLVSEVVGSPIPYSQVEAKQGEMRGVRVTNALAKTLGVEFKIGLKEGLQRVWQDFASIQNTIEKNEA